jgi:PAS domain S-box-containing protein
MKKKVFQLKTEGKSKEKLLEELKKLKQRISELEECEIKHSQVEEMNSRLNYLKDEIIGTPSFNGKLKLITDDLVDILDADFAGIWMIKEGDLCEEGCIHAEMTEGPQACIDRTRCLHLIVSSSQYSPINGYHQRVPFGCQRIGGVASSNHPHFITNAVMLNPQIHDYEWAQKLGIVSFAGFRLLSQGGNPVGVMALFSHHKIGLEEERLLDALANTTSHVIRARISGEELIASEEKFRNIIEQSYDGFALFDEKGRITEWNPAQEHITGLKREDVLGRFMWDVTFQLVLEEHKTPELHEIMKNGMNKICMTGKISGRTMGHEMKIKRLDGTCRIVEIVDFPIQTDKGFIGSSITRDVTERKQIELALSESEKNFRAIAENASEGILIGTGDKGIHVYANQMATEITGYAKEELIKKSIADLAHPDELNKLIAIYKSRITGKTVPSTHETYIINKNNELVPVEITGARTVWKGQPADLVLIRDIIQRKKAEKKLEQANIYNRNLIEVSLDPLVTIGPEGKINDVNKATEKVTGHSREEIIGSDFSDYFTEPDKARKGYEKVFKEGFVRDYPLEIQHKNGHITPVLYNASVYQDEANRVVGVFAAARDITQLREAEEKLKSSQKRLKILFDYAPDSLFLLDLKGNLVDCNLAVKEILGYGKEELIGKNFAKVDIIPRRQIPKLAAKLAKIALGNHPIEPIELDFTRKDGKLITMEMTAYLVNIQGQKLLFAIGRDTTERKQMEEQISQSLEEKEMLLREIHHRVKNNLMVISSLLNLQSQYIKDEEALGIFKESQSRARSMAIIHERLYQSTDLKRIDFGEYIQTLAMELFRTYQGDPGLIKMKINVENLEIDINTTVPLGLIVNELVSNCLKHAFPDGKKGDININFHKINDEYVLKVCDTGVGFPEDLDFKKTESLGLQLVTNLTGQIDGKIELDRSHGTEFTIKFKELEL